MQPQVNKGGTRMKPRRGTFIVVAKTHYARFDDTKAMHLEGNELSFETQGSIDSTIYIDGKGQARKMSANAVTDTLVLALITHIRTCHEKGWADSGEYIDQVKNRIDAALVLPDAQEVELQTKPSINNLRSVPKEKDPFDEKIFPLLHDNFNEE